MNAKLFVLYFLITTFGWYSTCVQCVGNSSDSSQEPALLVVSYDGFHPKWINEKATPNLFKFRRDGVAAPYMLGVFPTKTFPNHFTIATGLYTDKHGVMGSSVFDTNERIIYSEKLFKFKKDVKPIWTLNQQAENKHSGCMMWSGSNFNYHNTTITHYEKLDMNMTKTDRVDKVMSWFTNKTHPANFVMMYIEDPDDLAHLFGCESQQVKDKIKEVDELTGYIQDQLKKHKLEKRVNVIHLSDHGMVDVTRSEFIKLNEYTTDKFSYHGLSPVLQIIPNDTSKTAEVYANLTKAAERLGTFKIYYPETLPKDWHANNRRMGPIVAVANVGHAFHDMFSLIEWLESNREIPIHEVYGLHGYDNFHSSMYAMFMAKGPHFKEKMKLQPVNMVDLYNLFCSILKLECEPNDGSTDMSIWNNLLKKPPTLLVIKQKVRQSFTQLRGKPTK